MGRYAKLCSLALTLTILLLSAVTGASASFFDVETIQYPGASDTIVLGTNNTGQAVGTYVLNGTTHGFIWDSGNYTSVDVPGAASTYAYDINDNNQVVGYYIDANNKRHGFLLENGTYTDIDVPGANQTWAFGINNAGDIVGMHRTGGSSDGFLWDGNSYASFAFPGASLTKPNSVNDAQNVVGTYVLNGMKHGFLWDGQDFTLIDHPDATQTEANDINSNDQVAGFYRGAAGLRSFIWDTNGFTELGFANQRRVYAFDDSGRVGGYYTSSGAQQGFLAEELTPYANVTAQAGLVLAHNLAPICEPPIGVGSAWADYNNDGRVDLYTTNQNGANHLYRNDGDTNADDVPDFTDVAAATGVDLPGSVSLSACFIDYDNDGDQDLYVTNWGGNTLFQNQLTETGAATFVDVTAFAGVADGGRGITSAWADFDNDGYLDFYIAKHYYCVPEDPRLGEVLYHNNGDGTFTNVTNWLCGDADGTCPQVMGSGFAPGWFDYDMDGDLDLYVVRDYFKQDYPNVLWRNDGPDGQGGWLFTDVSAESGTDKRPDGMGLGIGDYDNNGYFDLAFSNSPDKPNFLLQNLGNGAFADVGAFAGIEARPSTTWGTVFFDYDNDGWLDLYIVAGYVMLGGQPNQFYANNRDGTFTDISEASGLNDPGKARNASIADIDDDGFVDVFVGNFGGPPALLHNQSAKLGNTNNWLVITTQGTVSNRDGIGTLVQVDAGGQRMIRQITSGPTHGGGDQKAAYFGVGVAKTAKVSLYWPSGIVQHLGRIPVNQKLHVVEPGAVAAPATTGDEPQGTVVYSNYPNPFNPETWIPYQLSSASSVRLTIYDIRGTQVRSIDVGYKPAGVYLSRSKAIYWDGRNAVGEYVASGVYFYRFDADDYSATRRMVILK